MNKFSSLFGTFLFLSFGLMDNPLGNPITVPSQGLIRVSVKSLVELRFDKVVRQTRDLSCGAAALATLFTYYYGMPFSEEQIIEGILRASSAEDKEKIQKHGFSMLELKRAGERLGFVSGGFRIPVVKRLAQLEVPAITLVNNRGYNHFVVIKGLANNEVFIADPAFGNRSRSLESFAAEWNNVILVFVNDTASGDSTFSFKPTPEAPAQQVFTILDRAMRNITSREPGEF